MLLVCLILGAVGGSSVVLYKALELAITGVQESIEKSSTADANAFANKFVALLHSFATVTFALMVLATFPYGSRELLALRHTGEYTISYVFVNVHGCDVVLFLLAFCQPGAS